MIANEYSDKWINRFFFLARLAGSWSKDPSTKVGAVLVDEKKIVCGIGYNGFPRGVTDNPEMYEDRELKYKMIVHAEMNAILNASKSVEGSALFLWPFMSCSRCACSVIQAGISSVYYPVHQPGSEFRAVQDRWKEDNELAVLMFIQAGVKVHRKSWCE